MRLRQAFTGVLCIPVSSLRALPPPSQYFLFGVRPITSVPIRNSFKLNHSVNVNLHLSTGQVLSHGLQSQLTRQSACYFSSDKQPLALALAASSAKMSEGVVNKDMEENSQASPESKLADDNMGKILEGEQAETDTVAVAHSSLSRGEGQVQVTPCADQSSEKASKAECSQVQGDANGTISQSLQQARSAPPSNKSSEPDKVSQLSKRAQKKLLRKQKLKEQRKAKRGGNFTNNSSPGFDNELFSQTDYYFENGLRKVYPYHYTFSTYAKERWYGRTLQDIFEWEFRVDSPDNFRTSLAKGLMRVNGKVASLDHVIRNGDLIEHDIHRHENPVSDTPFEILEDTEELVVINKPASIPCHPCGKFRFNSIVFIMGKELGYANLRNIYRLDRLTSGVLIMGKTARKTKELENQVLHRRVQKEYVARVVGEFPPEEVTVDKPLDCLSHKLTLWRVVQKGGKPSRTTFQRLSYNGQTSVVRCIPHTGRTHQIRVHLQYLGHPIVNDPYYNSPAWGPQRGKGGHCDVSLEELCHRIMKEHNVGLWCDGENPLFQQHLAEAQASQHPSLHTPDFEEGVGGTADTPAASELDEEGGRCGGEVSAESPPAKRSRRDSSPASSPRAEGVAADCVLPPSTPASQTAVSLGPVSHIPASVKAAAVNPASVNPVKLNPTLADPTSETSVSSGHGLGVGPVSQSAAGGTSESGKTSDLVEAQGQMTSEAPAVPEEVCGAERRSRMEERKGFDPKRWVPDLNCESCRLRYIDPKPTDLLLYLHALRYKGPGWDYSTRMPDWAQDSWQEPDDYSKYLQ